MSKSNGYTPPLIKPADLRGILKYVPRFQGQIFVIAVDGSIVADENFGNLLVDIAVLRSLGIKVVLVHGIGHQMQELSTARSIAISNTDGTGVTDAPTLDLAIRASARVSQLIMEGLTQNALKCAITNAVRAIPIGIIRGVDQQFTGKLDRLDKDFVDHLLSAAILPIIQPIGYGPDGRPYRINSDLLAAGVAESLGASKIIYLMPHAGLEINGEIRREISYESLRHLLTAHPAHIAESGRSKAIHALHAISAGVPRIHIVDGRAYDGLINEIFSNEGVGTLIYGNEYQQIRQARKSDTRFIWSLTRAAVRREELLCRTQQAIEKNIDQFFVYEIDENIIACVTLYFYFDTNSAPSSSSADKPVLAEIGSLYVMPFYQNRGVGRKLVDYACLRAKDRGVRTIVALSTQSFSFFTSVMGFEEVDKTILPEARLKAYEDNGRNARVLRKTL
ncbi:amino-acid N-acetyltransferase [Geminisphaera colitermitum]|uniref:amino-acid N-acetyltransferase n=1 Tax=Geminisphaera colitermitum TaxID=1148786 RepID=UPI0001965072|nr:amino-acid N-acetyltransferase [Geminisphaera colitermitum]